MGKAREVKAEEFDAAVAAGVKLVEFGATWCGPCRMMAGVLDQVAEELGDDAEVLKVDIDEAKELAVRFGVRNVPAIFVLKNAETADQFVGVQTRAKLVDAVRKAIG